jgi:hypothetical protein
LIRVEDLRLAMARQGLLHRVEANSASSVIDSRQASTRRLNQSSTAAR